MLLRKPSSMPLKPSPLIGTSIRPRSLGQVSAVNAVVPPPCLPIPYLPLVLPLRAPFGLFMPPCVPLDPLVDVKWLNLGARLRSASRPLDNFQDAVYLTRVLMKLFLVVLVFIFAAFEAVPQPAQGAGSAPRRLKIAQGARAFFA